MIGGVGQPGLLAVLAQNSAGVRGQLETTLAQQSSGKVAPAFAGLGAGARTTLDLRPAVQHQQVWQNNIDQAAGRLDATQAVLKQVGDIAASFYAQTNDINHIGTSRVEGIAISAKLALQQVGQLLNTKVGNIYVFAGQDTDRPPVPDTDPAVLGAALLASDTATAPFSATIGTAVPEVEVGEGQRVPTGVLATRNTLATSEAPTTGSYLRDVMRALATLAGLSDGPGVEAVAADTRSRLSSAIGAIGDESGALGNLQRGLETRKQSLAAAETSLTRQVSNVEDVDMAAVLTKVSALQTQLQASYQVIAGVKDLSLSRFI